MPDPEFATTEDRLRVRSALPGRVRWDVPRLRKNEALCAHLQDSLLRLGEVTEVIANPATGRLLVCCKRDLPLAWVDERVSEALGSYGAPTFAVGRGTRAPDPRTQFASLAHDVTWIAGTALCAPAVVVGVLTGASPLAIATGAVALAFAISRLAELVDVRSLPADDRSRVHDEELDPLLEALYATRKPLLLAVALAAGSVVLSLAPFGILALAIAVVTGVIVPPLWLGGAASGWPLFAGLAGLCLVAMAANSACEYAGQILWRNSGETVMHRLRMQAYAHVQRAQASYFIDESPGAVLSRLGEDINQIEKMFTGAWEFIQIMVSLSLVSSVVMAVAPNFAWVVLLLVPGFVAATRRLRERIVPLYRAVRSESALLSAEISSSFDGLVTIKAFSAEARLLQQIDARSHRVRQLARPAIAVGAGFRPAFELVVMSGIVLVAVLGALAAGSFFDFAIYAALLLLVRELLWPLSQLGVALEMYQRGFASYRRAMSVLAAPAEELELGLPLDLVRVRGELSFRDVDFAYRTDTLVFRGISMRLQAGKSTAIVGPSGAGKTTLLKLLLRFHAPQRGQVLLDGQDVQALRLDHLRRAISVVSQEIFLFDGSIEENLRFARPDATPAEIEAAARGAELHDFIRSLPEGYQSRIGQRGLRLSGGQRQRLAVARVLLRGSPIVFLDEATSHVDNQTEAMLQRSVTHVLRGRTVVTIAHRLSTIADADWIYVLDGGRLREQGTHRELLQQGGVYAHLWQLQARQTTE